MARIPDEVLERIKQDISVLRLAENMGCTFKKSGADNFIGCCPFHDDQNPSLVISVKKNVFHCLACGAKGSPIDWVMMAQKVSFRHAAELLREQSPSLAAPITAAKVSTVRHLELPFDPEADDATLLRQVVDYYHETLKQTPDALAYLKKRGLESPEMVDHFKLGYADRTLGYRVPERNRQLGAELRERLQKLGIIRDTGHEHFNGSLIIPVFSQDGDVTEIYGRKVGSALRKGTPLHLYLPGPHRGVWNEQGLASKEVILCESLIDALTFWCAGYRNVTASYGVNGFTDDHLEAFKRHKVERVVIAYDRDDAGDKAAAVLSEQLVAQGMTCYRIQFPHGLDANEYALKVQPPTQSLALLIRSAIWLGGTSRDRAPAASSLVARSSLAAESQPAAKQEVSAISKAASGRAQRAPGAPGSSLAEHDEHVGGSDAASVKAAAKEEVLTATQHDHEQAASSLAARFSSVAEAVPPSPVLDGDDFVIRLDDRTYRLRGLPETVAFERLHANIVVTREMPPAPSSSLASGIYIERLDLYARSQRAAFAKEASFELRVQEDLIKRDLGRVLLAVEKHIEAQARQREAPVATVAEMSEDDRKAALELLQSPNLLDRILDDFTRCGVVGEETNKLMGYLAVVSRKLEEPLAVIVQSSSAAGKSSLMEAVLAFVPPEDRVKYSAMTGQSLYYLGESDLKHKVLAIVEEEGAEKASYALKLLQSEGELTIASTGKDPTTGKLVTQDYHVEGPVMLFMTTTAAEIDEELLNRAIVLTVNEERAQTRAIHELQRERQTLQGQLARQERKALWDRHRNAQRLLAPMLVTNPFARELTFLDTRTRMRRDHLKYLTLIRAIALLHQHQREVKTTSWQGEPVSYIEATPADIAMANRLAHEVLGRSLDELAPQTRRLLEQLDALVRKRAEEEKVECAEVRFNRREVRQYTGWSAQQLQVHLGRLVSLEYVVAHQGGRGVLYNYELLYNGEGHDTRPFLMGLAEIEPSTPTTIESTGTEQQSTGTNPKFNGPSTAHQRPIFGSSTVAGNGASPHSVAEIRATPATEPKNARSRTSVPIVAS